MTSEPGPAHQTGVEELDPAGLSALDAWVAAHERELVEIRRHLHAHPERSGEEHETTAFLARELEAAGLRPVPVSSGTGLVCDVGSGEGPVVALRADIDALPMDDEKDVPYRSTVPGVCHACGHDAHTAVVLGVARFLATLGEVPGTVRCIFQPAEERVPGGALDVLADGALEGVSSIYGIHCYPSLDAGRVGLREGPITAAADLLRITLTGPGGHTARPEETADLVRLAATLATGIPDAVRRDAGGDVKVVFGAINAGSAPNVIPTTAQLAGTARTPDLEVWERLPVLVRQAVDSLLAGDPLVACDLDHVRGIPPAVNDPEATAVVRDAATRVLGPDAVAEAPQSWGGDDFAWYLREVPGSFVRLGSRAPGSTQSLDLHAGDFDVDERLIGVGVRVLAATALLALERTAGRPAAAR